MRRGWTVGDGAEIDWLVELTGPEVTGFDPGGTPDGLWILNAMYENETPSARTHHERHRADLADGTTEPWRFGSYDERDHPELIVPGGGLGWSAHPGAGWRRLLWSELAERIGDPIVPPGLYPSYRAFPSVRRDGSWPESILPPTEGSMDRDSFRRLATVLARFDDPRTTVFAHYCPCVTGEYDEYRVYRGRLGDLDALEELNGEFGPSNLWPADRAWLTYTDYDLWGTKVSGPPELLRLIDQDDVLETVRLPLSVDG
ncbi:hypothetical protein [Stackebrandtia soli]|uniref:hypothetical protein n=1 Tax=Stackebrandtia soli TaxID=1892856 RepID=UPI0039E8D9F9